MKYEKIKNGHDGLVILPCYLTYNPPREFQVRILEAPSPKNHHLTGKRKKGSRFRQKNTKLNYASIDDNPTWFDFPMTQSQSQ